MTALDAVSFTSRHRGGATGRWRSQLLLPALDEARDGVSDQLHPLHDDDEHDDRPKHDVALEPLIAIAIGQVAQAAATNDAGHGRVADQVDDRDRDAPHQRRY